jgi:hypothetical protein
MPQPLAQRRFNRLSEAILRGCTLHGEALRAPGIGGREGRGALRAAWLSQFPDATEPGSYLTDDLSGVYQELRRNVGNSCPSGPNTSCPDWPKERERTLSDALVHLEDTHNFTPERVAAWLRAYGF